MLRFASLFFLALACSCAGAECITGDDGKLTCPNTDQTALLQSRVHVEEVLETNIESFSYGPTEISQTMLEIFKGWSKGLIESRLARVMAEDRDDKDDTKDDYEDVDISEDESSSGGNDDDEEDDEELDSMMDITTEALSASEAMGMLAKAMGDQCPEKIPVLLEETQYQVLQSEVSEEAGIRHVLLKDHMGRLQYMAAHQLPNGEHQSLAEDPPICSNVGSLAAVETDGDPLQAEPLGDGGKGSGGSNLLLLTDPLVESCKALFANTFVETCGRAAPNVTVLSAHRVVIDGLKVHMRIVVNGHPHHPDCTYETSADHTDASLVESVGAEDTKGLIASLHLNVPLCDCVAKDGGADLTDSLLQQYSFGENSLYVGNEHVNDDIPVYSALEVEVPSSLDFRTKYSRCYPALAGKGPGTETVRNQGTCGSCWAFAAATSAMANLCITDTSNKHSFHSASDRFEVSVQKIMSCKAKGASTANGCHGGNMNQFGEEASTWGLTKERDNLYRCGGGDPKKHFEHTTGTCDAFPWAGQCTGKANAAWWWGGAARVDGESSMQTFLASGQSMYISIAVYSNFMNLRGSPSLYTSTSGSKQGGHAMNCLGYGTLSGTKYWLIQNSWGPNGWGDHGYCKFKRGTNLAGIESGAYAPRVWVTGGQEPPCQDSKSGAGISSTGRAPFIPCNQAKSYCSRSGWPVAKNCPKTCGTCAGFNGAGNPSPPTPPGPPAPAPPPPPPPTPAGGGSCCRGSCQSTSDCASNLFCCPYHHMCMDTSTGSTAGPNCNKCKGNPPSPPPSPNPPSPPAPSPNGCADRNPSGIRLGGKMATCPQLKRYCARYSFVRDRCKLTCGKCPPPPSPPSPPPSPPPPAPGCADRNPSGIRLGGKMATCPQLKRYCARYSFVRDRCKVTCGKCGGGGGTPACKDDSSYKTSFDWNCATSAKYLKYLSSSLQSTVKQKCKKSTGQCR